MRAYPILTDDEDQLDFMLATTEIGLWEWDAQTDVVLRNLRHDQIYGYSEMLPDWSFDIFIAHVVPEQRASIRALVENAIATRSQYAFDLQFLAADGTKGWLNASGFPKLSETGEVRKLVGHIIDITEIKRNEARLQLLADELNHRVKNTLGVVQSIAYQSFDQDNDRVPYFMDRLGALSKIHDVLLRTYWEGADIHEIVAGIVKVGQADAINVKPGCPNLRLTPKVAVIFAMALHELCSNSIKHGSLGADAGTVDLGWSVAQDTQELTLIWQELGGPQPKANRTPGFGSSIIEDALPYETNGTMDMNFAPTGLIATLTLPLANSLSTPLENR